MTDEAIDAQIASLEAAIEVLRGMKRSSVPTATPGQFISPSQATAICGRSESQVRRDCESNPVDAGGFGLKYGGRWLVEESTYRAMRGNARLRR